MDGALSFKVLRYRKCSNRVENSLFQSGASEPKGLLDVKLGQASWLACHESARMHFQPGEGPSRGLLRDCEN